MSIDSTCRPIIDPDPLSAQPLILTYKQVGGDEFSTAIADILKEPKSKDMDDAGNRIVAVAMAQPIDVCEYGFLGGRSAHLRRWQLCGSLVDPCR